MKDIQWFVALFIGLCTQQIFRTLVINAIKTYIGLILLLGYFIGVVLWEILLMMPQILMVVVTACSVYYLLNRLQAD
jgi:hypothetical protein